MDTTAFYSKPELSAEWQEFYQRRFVLNELLQNQLHFVEILEAMHAFTASAQFARRLRSA